MQDKISQQKINKYFSLTNTALKITKKAVVKGKEKKAKEIFEMVENYLSDSMHFRKKEDLVNSFAAINYAHGWIDAGVRLGIFDVKDDKLFTVK